MRRAPVRLFRPRPLVFAVAWVLLGSAVFAEGTRPLTFVDLMKMRTIDDPVIADHGNWIAYQAKPDRGDGAAIVRATTSDTAYDIARGMAPIISSDGRFVAARVAPSVADAHAAKDEPKDQQPQPGAALLSTADGATTTWDRVQTIVFSNDAAWLAVHHHPPLDDPADDSDSETKAKATPGPDTKETVAEASVSEESVAEQSVATQPIEGPEAPSVPGAETPSVAESGAEATGEDEGEGEEAKDAERVGALLTLVDLNEAPDATSGARATHTLEHVETFAFDESGRYLAYTVATPEGANGVFILDLATPDTQPLALHEMHRGRYTALSWAKDVTRLGFVAAEDDADGEPGDAAVWTWSADAEDAIERIASNQVGDGWRVPSVNALAWSRDGARLFFGRKPAPNTGDDELPGSEAGPDEDSDDADGDEEETPYDPYDVETLLADRGVDVWHWNDPRIIPNQKKMWEETEKDRTYRAVLHHADGRVVLLADEGMPDTATDDRGVTANLDNPHAVLALADTPYLKEITWDGFHQDVYRQSLTDGGRQRVVARLRNADGNVALSPDGRFVVYYQTPHWYLYDGENASTHNLTEGLDVPFDDEDHDYPQPAPGYDFGGWVASAADGPVEAVLIHDKYDIWSFATADRQAGGHEGGRATCLTDGQGRRDETLFRVQDVDDEQAVFLASERLLVTGYRDRSKSWGIYGVHADRAGVETLMAGDYKLEIVAKAKHADRLLFTRERYDEFPDLRVTDLAFQAPKRLSDLNPQIADFAWGEAELVSWQSADGLPLDGVLIKPGNYQPGQRYPVLVYYYRLFSQRLHSFNQPVINHRPSFPLYASNGYAVFLPDIRFEVGRPGPAAVKSLLPGVQKLIEMGIADPDAIGLHGHSWSGYQTAYVVTQTNRFAAAVAGAPVSNMTSAYGGIRWGSGLSRQFQYEQSQSRLGASLWEGRDRYIDNSPVFFADRIETPLLIMFGDEDEAVPWYQGIELYMALRRLEKDAVFLQYRGEGHHPKQYPNKLDYSIKMKEYFDHYLKGVPAADWITHGVPYQGE